MKKEIFKTLRYFARFKYAPTFDELYLFLKTKALKRELVSELKLLQKDQKLLLKSDRYTLPEYSIYVDMTLQKRSISMEKKEHIRPYISLLSYLPFIKLVGLSGSVAMNNGDNMDDIDLFIITQQKRMWITRLVCLMLAELLGKRRKRSDTEAKDKICLNLFFDERNLEVPSHKKTLYIAHEILQMKPIVVRNSTYETFLTANLWVFDFFPNAQNDYIKKQHKKSEYIKNKKVKLSFLGNFLEQLVKQIQLFSINRHKTKELITPTQLWFFPRDFEELL